MRISLLSTLPLLGSLALAPHQGSAQVNVTIKLGNPVPVTRYAPEAYGDWHTDYQSWRPVTLYAYQGNLYTRQVSGSRPVALYRTRQGDYFLPPQDRDWDGKDHRYNYKRRPSDDDYERAGTPSRGKGRGPDGNGPPGQNKKKNHEKHDRDGQEHEKRDHDRKEHEKPGHER